MDFINGLQFSTNETDHWRRGDTTDTYTTSKSIGNSNFQYLVFLQGQTAIVDKMKFRIVHTNRSKNCGSFLRFVFDRNCAVWKRGKRAFKRCNSGQEWPGGLFCTGDSKFHFVHDCEWPLWRLRESQNCKPKHGLHSDKLEPHRELYWTVFEAG